MPLVTEPIVPSACDRARFNKASCANDGQAVPVQGAASAEPPGAYSLAFNVHSSFPKQRDAQQARQQDAS